MEEPHPKPKGTIAVLIIFALMIVILWSSVYIALLLRGTTQ
jgi:flagellar basal body-associated protein FliL